MSYERTHPWLTFKANLGDLPPKTWVQLGECASKCDHISGIPLKPGIKQELQLVYLAKGIRATTAIEGNTLTEEEVRKIIEKKTQTPLSKEYLEQEIENILKACNQIAMHVRENIQIMITAGIVCEYNKIVLEDLPVEEGVQPGVFRDHRVTVGRYLSPTPEDVPILIEKLCHWLNGEEFISGKGYNPISFAILKAIIAHLYIAWIHPFGDGNGRTARLIEFKILAQSGVPLPAAHLLSNHYNATRTEYYNQLDRTSKAGGKITDFVAYAVQGYLDGLNEQLAIIREHEIQIALENYIHEKFREKKTEAWRRRRHLALDISITQEPVKRNKIPLLSERLNEAYKSKTDRALMRDLSALLKMGLIVREGDRFRINKRPIIEFMPVRRET